MSLEERTYICKTLIAKPQTKTTTLQFDLANRFGTTWDLSTIRLNRKAMGFNPKVSSPYNRASDPIARNQYCISSSGRRVAYSRGSVSSWTRR